MEPLPVSHLRHGAVLSRSGAGQSVSPRSGKINRDARATPAASAGREPPRRATCVIDAVTSTGPGLGPRVRRASARRQAHCRHVAMIIFAMSPKADVADRAKYGDKLATPWGRQLVPGAGS